MKRLLADCAASLKNIEAHATIEREMAPDRRPPQFVADLERLSEDPFQNSQTAADDASFPHAQQLLPQRGRRITSIFALIDALFRYTHNFTRTSSQYPAQGFLSEHQILAPRSPAPMRRARHQAMRRPPDARNNLSRQSLIRA